jgi:hypothetical protein
MTHTPAKTKTFTNSFGYTFTVATVTSHYNVHYGRTYYTTHRFMADGHAIPGGCSFPASNPKTCAYYGVPVIAND